MIYEHCDRLKIFATRRRLIDHLEVALYVVYKKYYFKPVTTQED